MRLGLHRITNDEYHSSEGISKTKLDMFTKDEGSIEWAKECPLDNEKLKTLDFGDACHAIILEPDRLESDFVVMPELNLRTKDGQQEAKAFRWEHRDKCIITSNEFKKLQLMRDSVFAHPGCRKWLNMKGESEQSWYYRCPRTGLLLKCRPDRNVLNTPVLLDVKTTELISKFHFSVEDYRYYVQDPFYTDILSGCGEEKKAMIFLVVQKTIELGRYPVRLIMLPPEVTEYGRREYERNLDEYLIAQERGFSNTVQTLDMGPRFNRKVAGATQFY